MMYRCRPALAVLALLTLVLLIGRAAADTPARPVPAVAIEDFSYLDTSGEPTDQAAVHEQRRQAFMAALRRDIEADHCCRLVPSIAQGEAGIRIIGAIQKMSTLIQWAKVTIIDVGANKVLLDRQYSFRGDNDAAWDHARSFILGDIRATLTGAAPMPINR